ncbi:MAG: radical SAM protein [Planctomycetes bacterium]|nr:radical SAM protein [Planctomycetota bacterium]
MKHLFGPVPSRRLGNSLGVDLLTHKACTFDCVYCQLGRTTEQTTQRRSFVPAAEAIAEVRQALDSGAAVDYVTLSGSGEPTLSLDLGRVVRAIKAMTRVPVAVLTNGSLLGRPDVQADLAEADLVVPSLDAGTQAAFERVNRPQGMDVRDVARGIRDFTLGFGGQVWLEVLVVAGMNDSPDEARAIVGLLEGARLDKVQLNTVVRAPAEEWARPVGEEQLRELAAILEGLAPVEIIGRYAHKERVGPGGGAREAILATLARRPCGAAELATSLGLERPLVAELLEELCRSGETERVPVGGTMQYRIPARSHAESV